MDAPGGFEDWLREQSLPRPRPAFQARLRERFLELSDRTSESASRELGPERTGEVLDFVSFLRKSAPPPSPREAFRAELRGSFLAARASKEREAVATPVAPRSLPDRGSARAPARPRSWLFPSLVGLAAAAALVALLVPVLRRPSGPWRVVGVEGATTVSRSSGGPPIASRNGTIDLGDLLEHPEEFTVETGSLRLAFEDEFRMEVRPGTRLALARDGSRALSLPQGELFLQTFAGYGGSGLAVDTPDAQVSVHGTTLGVRADGMGTCVCVVDGKVDLHERKRNQDVSVPRAYSHLVLTDASMPSKIMPFPPGKAAPGDHEHEHVDRLREFAAAPWQ